MIPSLATQLLDYQEALRRQPLLTDFRARDKATRQRQIVAWVKQAGWFRVPELVRGAGFSGVERARTWARDAFERGELERRGKWNDGYEYRWKDDEGGSDEREVELRP